MNLGTSNRYFIYCAMILLLSVKSVVTTTSFWTKMTLLFLKKFYLIRVCAEFLNLFLPFYSMRYQYIVNEQTQRLDVKAKRKTVSTLRVPFYLNSTFKRGMNKHGNLTKYLDVLIKRYRFLFYTNYFKPSENPKTQYQQRGQFYITHKFRPENRDWLELKLWADALGISATYMFVKLLEFEKAHEAMVNEKAFRMFSIVVTTSHYARLPQVKKALRKGRSILERGITFYDPPLT